MKTVAQIFDLLFHRLAGRASGWSVRLVFSRALQNEILRNSRLQVCATSGGLAP